MDSCGIISDMSPKATDISGQRFGRLVALNPTGERAHKGRVVWLCTCDCGNKALVVSSQLTQGRTKSCGCLRKETAKLDLRGRKFTKLTVLEDTGLRYHRQVVWLCRCDCGNAVYVPSNRLQEEQTKSCGCSTLEWKRQANLTHGMSDTLEYYRWRNYKNRALIKERTIGQFTVYDIEKKMYDWGNQCIYCGEPREHVDHLIPLNRGGDNSLYNLMPSCASCNLSKGSKYLGSEWWPKNWGVRNA